MAANVSYVTFLHRAREFVQARGIDVSRFPGEHSGLRVVQMLQHSGVTLVLDVGANDGGYGAELRRFGYEGGIASFEPLTDVFLRLQARSSADPKWAVTHCAVGAESGKVQINVAANGGASSSLLPMLTAHEKAAPGAKIIGTQEVDLRSLDELWPQVVSPADTVFLKVDVQGYERQVLQGVDDHLGLVVGVQLELSLVPLYQGAWPYEEALSWARDQGFSLRRVIPGFSDPQTGDMLQADGVFFRN